AFALVSVAAVIDVDDSGPDPTIRDVALALGGVAHKPWRARAAEAELRGARPTAENFRRAADAELEDPDSAEYRLGDADTALAGADVVIDAVYTTPLEHNNPMEPHTTVARWEDRKSTRLNSSHVSSSYAVFCSNKT